MNDKQVLPILPRWLVIGFSGHRHLHDKAGSVDQRIREAIAELAGKHPRCGCMFRGQRADSLFAKAMLDRQARFPSSCRSMPPDFPKDFEGEPRRVRGRWPRKLSGRCRRRK